MLAEQQTSPSLHTHTHPENISHQCLKFCCAGGGVHATTVQLCFSRTSTRVRSWLRGLSSWCPCSLDAFLHIFFFPTCVRPPPTDRHSARVFSHTLTDTTYTAICMVMSLLRAALSRHCSTYATRSYKRHPGTPYLCGMFEPYPCH